MKINDLTRNALMIALLAVCSQLSIPIQPVPITLQTLAVMLIGILLTPKNTLFVTVGYLVLGLVGIPVFANYSGGLSSVMGPAFGFIIAFIPAACLQALYLSRQANPVKKSAIFISLAINVVVTYAIGLPYMYLILKTQQGVDLGLTGVLTAGLLPFIPGDLLKVLVAGFIGDRLRKQFS
ncbi:hypothetical protein AWM75_00865 [Aerococcus urinaehominis]|uniref:Biotin transporter n=1 Tax=Aerococcus urinaehominis TaxID=128944 RepID=A0A0X8FL47_9LACT|nr:biotin transporter BioY [Aerococcus urinaehominis]AMB98632.1 hypothetical protein AWM75_00865 [Aerococcus urinaehominis]SDL96051.1 biotin transport system substrate-specific component [Aerococcus urinaehominis]